MQFLVYGAGAVGSLVGARLARSHEVTLLGRTDHVRAIRTRGLTIIETDGARERVDVRAIDDANDLESSVDYVLVTVKSFDTARVASRLKRWSGSHVVSLQNGLGNEEILARENERVIAAVINQGAVLAGPGEVHHAGGETSLFGPHAAVAIEAVESLVAAFIDSGLPARSVPNIGDEIWRKAIINAAVNPLSALTRKRSGELIDNGPMERTIDAVLDESVTIALACGVSVDKTTLASDVRRILRVTRTNKTSMLQDVERSRPTEIESMNGALADRARQLGIAAPINQLIADLIRSLEPSAQTAPEA